MLIGISFIVCSLIYISLLSVVYFGKERIKTTETKIYSLLLSSNIIGLILELICCLTVMNMKKIPLLNAISNRLYLVYFATFVSLFTIYVYVACNKNNEVDKSEIIIFNKIEKMVMLISYTLLLGSVLLLPIKYYNGPDAVYSYGIATDALSFACCIYMIIDFICIFKNIKKLNKKKLIPIFALLICFVLAFIIRQINPGIILITCSFAFVTAIMYFTIENPDVKMVEDLTKANIQAEKANRAKSDFLSSMSHEIRTPLNAIVGFSEDIQKYKNEVNPTVVEDAQYILEASQTLLEIVGNILDINKIEADKMELVDVPYNFKEEVRAVCNVNSIRIEDKPINFKISIAEDIPYELIGDKVHVKQIVNNLLTNSMKYTESGEIYISVKCINNNNICNLIIGVKDTGRGIKKENIDKLFTKFERLDVEKNTTTEGTGLGLAITKKLVDMMGGKINVQSDFGKGSIFVVQIPQKISKMVDPNEKVEEQQEVEEVLLEGKKVLIVDDNLLNIKVARRALESFNFNLDDCDSGQACLDKINGGESYDLILMDIMMPNMSGEDTLEKLKQISGFNTPVIALTADAVAGAKEKYLSEGFVDYIAKPFTKDQISEKLEKVFKK